MSDYCNPSKAFDFLDYDFIASAVVFYLFTPHYSPFLIFSVFLVMLSFFTVTVSMLICCTMTENISNDVSQKIIAPNS